MLFNKKKQDKVKVHVVGSLRANSGNHMISKWILEDPFMELEEVPSESDVLLFTGGPDISPSIYHQPAHARTYSHPDRDQYEIAMFHAGKDKVKVGICRGAQLLNVLSGGSMFQDVRNHTDSHDIKVHTEGGIVFEKVTSTHHQMMIPSPVVKDRIIMATAWKNGRPTLCSYNDKDVPKEMQAQKWNFLQKYTTKDFNPSSMDLEMVFYTNTRSLCIQPHPEYISSPKPFTAYCSALIVKTATQNIKRLAKLSA